MRYSSEWDAHFCETEIASLPYRCGGIVCMVIEPYYHRGFVSSTAERCSPLQICCRWVRVSRKWLFYRLSGASVSLSGIVKQCQICRKCRKIVTQKWWEMESSNKMKLTYTNLNGYLISNLIYKSSEQMEQLGKYGFLRRDYLKNHKNSLY